MAGAVTIPAVGEQCYFGLNMDKCHLFDETTEHNIFYQ
ncbi:hypothetical protein JCM19237_1069 [Photobacterium aphoticum]|uniref:Maltose/maltodextrin transport ATP-binding protein MalK n=1 Tax=Photobacterium aphoticum TaxID=754436 RepID=A0A090R9X4_9GAMM|nr:hypothetical protein JCM19237_1069 [Photobacterium aphoticum]